MSYVEQLKKLIEEHGGSPSGIRTVSEAIGRLEETLRSSAKKPVERYDEPKREEPLG